jgi:hypothetical protein
LSLVLILSGAAAAASALVAAKVMSPNRAAAGTELDLSQAVVVAPAELSRREQRAVQMLLDEVEKRTMIRWKVTSSWSKEDLPVIAVRRHASRKSKVEGRKSKQQADLDSILSISFARALGGGQRADRDGIPPAEGYRIEVQPSRRAVFVIGNDERGVLFGVGRLLREMQMVRGKVGIASNLDVASAPKFPLRGHQLGYRPKTNSYDGWTPALWEQYIRDLAVFGTNAIELIPPRSDDDPDSLHFSLPPIEMMIRMSRLADDYGLDVWIWYPAMDADYSDAKTVEAALKEWGGVFEKLPRINAVFVPGGDPGHTRPKYLMSLLEKETRVLQRTHPKAQMWVSPQGFNRQWLDEFYAILRDERPAWLSGVVFGPQVRVSLRELREQIPKRYPIRLYPDITHSLRCQYPVPDWDLAYALTEEREGINPRPLGEAQIFHKTADYSAGFIAYSEGCNDDVNKIVWSSLGWDPNAGVEEILRQYSRYFIGENYRDGFSRGLLSLERNWEGPLSSNDGVYLTLQRFQDMEKQASPQVRLNWRFQQALYRAHYDAYERSRLLHETALEEDAMKKLREAKQIGAQAAMDQAETILNRSDTDKVSLDWRARVFELAEALFQSIRMQLSVQRYGAISVGRGANLDTIDVPLNNRVWLKRRLSELRSLARESERRAGIEAILHWTDPGPGGFYDDLGNSGRQPHLVRGTGFNEDPDFRESALLGFAYRPEWRTSWCDHADALFDTPLKMRYTNLDRTARYKVRIIYAGDNFNTLVRLLADDKIEIHAPMKKPYPVRPVEFTVPAAATEDGDLTLTWYGEAGRGGSGRGCQVAEVWLIRE